MKPAKIIEKEPMDLDKFAIMWICIVLLAVISGMTLHYSLRDAWKAEAVRQGMNPTVIKCIYDNDAHTQVYCAGVMR